MPQENIFLKACRLEDIPRTPVWLMRQAGRYLSEYREIRSKHSFLEMCKTPKVAAEVTLQPVDILKVDAAILFSDILVPVEAMGVNIEFSENKGPVIHNPIRTIETVNSLSIPVPEKKMKFVAEAIKIVKKKLNGKTPLIGFSGAPFTLASYIVEGGGSKNYENVKAMMHRDAKAYKALMDKISKTLVSFLNAQVDAGVDALQIFDSWVGCLSPHDYEKYAMPYTKKVIDGVKGQVPVIHFATGASALLELMKKAGGDVIGIDWRINLDEAWRRIGYDVGIQGNLDPAALLSSPADIERKVKDILERAENRPGHIFNLGHGVLPQTKPENVIAMVKAVKKWSGR